MSREATVFVVDNDPTARDFVARLAFSMGLQCRAFTSGLDFLAAYNSGSLGCLVTAVRVADIGGLQIQQRLLDLAAPLPVIFLSRFAAIPTVVRAMRAGAVDFLEKPCNEQTLWEDIQRAIRLCERREEQRRQRAEWAERTEMLSSEERELMALLIEGHRNREIAAIQNVSLRTVESRRQKLMEKLRVDGLVDFCFSIARQQPQYCLFRDSPCFVSGAPRPAGLRAGKLTEGNR